MLFYEIPDDRIKKIFLLSTGKIRFQKLIIR